MKMVNGNAWSFLCMKEMKSLEILRVRLGTACLVKTKIFLLSVGKKS